MNNKPQPIINITLGILIFWLIIIALINYSINASQNKLIFKIADEQIGVVQELLNTKKDEVDIWNVLNRMGEDYPPKYNWKK